MEFKNKTILITGASSGIGKTIAKELSKKDCNLILISRRKNFLDDLKKELGGSGNSILVIQCDVARKEEVVKVFERIESEKLKVDVAILNAGVGHEMKVENYNSGFAEEILNANFLGMIYFIEQLVPGFIKRKEGIIAGVSSLADNRGYSGSGFYCASKAAVSTYLEGLRVELKPHGVKVITVKPGYVKTPMTDKNKFAMPFLMPADKAAKIIVEGIREEKRIIQFPLPMVLLTRLIGLLPGSVYEFLATRVKYK